MTACRSNGRHEPRTLPGEHYDHCPATHCVGCWPCPHRHCLSCNRAHADATCPDCIRTARDDLATIVTLCGYPLLEEVLTQGAHSEAAALIGPASNPEAWRYRATSAMFGRLDAAYLDDCRDEAHPLWTLGWIETEWREAFRHPDPHRQTIRDAAAYISRMMHTVAALTEMPDGSQPPEFDDAKRRLAACVTQLRATIHDQNQGDPANIGCFDCGSKLERRLVKDGFEDHWTCRGCRRRYTYAEYNFALRAHLEAATQEATA